MTLYSVITFVCERVFRMCLWWSMCCWVWLCVRVSGLLCVCVFVYVFTCLCLIVCACDCVAVYAVCVHMCKCVYSCVYKGMCLCVRVCVCVCKSSEIVYYEIHEKSVRWFHCCWKIFLSIVLGVISGNTYTDAKLLTIFEIFRIWGPPKYNFGTSKINKN